MSTTTGEAVRKAHPLAMHDACIRLWVRFGPDDEVPVEPWRTAPDLQAESAAAWRRAWAEGTRFDRVAPEPSFLVAAAPGKDSSCPDIALGQGMSARGRALADEERRRRWREAIPVRGRFEHFHEDARMVATALEIGLPTEIRWQGGELHLHGFDKRKSYANAAFLGFEGGLGQDLDRVNRYWKSTAFLKSAGRPFALCTPDEVHWVAMAMREAGHDRVFLKSMETKRGVWTIDMPQGSTAASLRISIQEAMGEDLTDVLRSHDKPGLMVQPYLGFRREMRFFVVDGRIARGVPVRRADCVYDRTSRGRIEPRSCEAHDGYPCEPDRGRAAACTRVARRVIASMKAEHADRRTGRHPDSYVIDIGETSDGRTLPIELNSIGRSGRYGCDPGDVIKAMISSMSRRIEEEARQAEGKKKTASIPWVASSATDAELKLMESAVNTEKALRAMGKGGLIGDGLVSRLGYHLPTRLGMAELDCDGSYDLPTIPAKPLAEPPEFCMSWIATETPIGPAEPLAEIRAEPLAEIASDPFMNDFLKKLTREETDDLV